MRTRVALLTLVVMGGVARAQSVDLGHKTLGTLGLDAGSQPPTGVYAVDAVVAYRADRIVDGSGHTVPVALDAHAFANFFGVSGTYELPRLHTYVGATLSMPVSHVSVAVATDDARASLDDFGLGDLYARPLRLGWRHPRFEIVTGYGFYAPTGKVEPGGRSGIGRGHWTHETSLGGTVYFDEARRWRLSALSSYEHNNHKIAIDVKRGDTVQLQGGIGGRPLRNLELGVVGYGLWQVSDNTGSDVPAVLQGAREVDYGLGGELDVTVPALRTRLTARYAHDVVARSRGLGSLFLIGVTISAWSLR